MKYNPIMIEARSIARVFICKLIRLQGMKPSSFPAHDISMAAKLLVTKDASFVLQAYKSLYPRVTQKQTNDLFAHNAGTFFGRDSDER